MGKALYQVYNRQQDHLKLLCGKYAEAHCDRLDLKEQQAQPISQLGYMSQQLVQQQRELGRRGGRCSTARLRAASCAWYTAPLTCKTS